MFYPEKNDEQNLASHLEDVKVGNLNSKPSEQEEPPPLP